VHLLFHPSTWSATSYCYLEDLFVSPSVRGGGVGCALIEATYDEADRQGAERVYWLTAHDNAWHAACTTRSRRSRRSSSTAAEHQRLPLVAALPAGRIAQASASASSLVTVLQLRAVAVTPSRLSVSAAASRDRCTPSGCQA